MAIKIKDATVINALEGGIMIPVGNLEDVGTPWATTADQIKDFVDADKATVALTGSYDDLTNTPDLSAYVLLTNLNTNFYNKSQVNSLIGSISSVRFFIVEELPPDGEEGVIYLIKEADGENENNIYNEYIWLVDEARYELIGSTQADLTNYYTKSEVDGMIPTVNNSTITFTQGGVNKGSITLNQSSAATIALDAGGSGSAVQSNWDETDQTSMAYIQNKPTIPTVNNPQITVTQGGVTVGTFTLNQSSAATIALNESSQVQADWSETDTTDPSYIVNKPTIPTVNNPTIYFTQGGVSKGSITLNQSSSATIALESGGSGSAVQSNWDETDATSMAYIQNKPSLATVALSGSYNDLTNKPTIPAAQVNSDWNAQSGVSQILNKPTIPSSTRNLVITYDDSTTETITVYVQ